MEGIEKVNEAITERVLREDHQESYTLIIDPTIIEAEKRDAKMTYLGVKGYRPVVATLKEAPVPSAMSSKRATTMAAGLRQSRKP